MCYTPRNGQKCLKRRVLTTPICSCIWVHRPSKSSPNHKTVCYNSRKGLEMSETMSFDTKCSSTGGLVTAPVWYPKIWANFSLFALHCIMAYICKLLKLNKATLGNLKLGKQNPSQMFQTKYKTQFGKTNCS